MKSIFLVVAVLALAGGVAAKAPPTLQQSLDLQTVAGARISPDGRRVIYEQTRTNWTTNAFENDLWIADVASGERHLLTTAIRSNSSAAWSPDGRFIALLSDRPGVLPKSPAERQQLWVMPADGGEAQQLTRFDGGVNSFRWAPDSRRLVAVAAHEPDAVKARKETFGDYHVIHADYSMAHLWLIDLPLPDAAGHMPTLGEPRPLTKGEDFSVGGFDISPDGTRVAFSAQRDPDLISGASSRVYVVDMAGGAPRVVAGEGGPNTGPVWSPDGREIAFETAAGDKYFFYANRRVGVVAATGGPVRIVTPDFDEDAQLLRWTPDGIYISALQKTDAGLFRVDPARGVTTPVTFAGTTLARGVTFADDLRHVAYTGAGANQYPEVYVADLKGGRPVALTHSGDQLKAFDTARREVVQWKSKDGTTIEGVLYTPVDFDPHRKYPLLVVIHGGPTGVDTPALFPDRYYPIERWVARGAVVLKPNYRGSAGYGARFRALNVRNLGVGDYEDVISGVDSLIAKGVVDANRVGAMGWSEGGYISAFITTSSDRFKAVSVGAGISDWMTYYANTDITPFAPQYLKATPWDDQEIYRKTSPISYIAHAKTPTLIQHGGADRRVPIANAYELRQALEDHGVPVKMVVYDGFGHPINKPKQQHAVMEENENWFDHYIFGDPLAPALNPDQPAKDGGATMVANDGGG